MELYVSSPYIRSWHVQGQIRFFFSELNHENDREERISVVREARAVSGPTVKG